MAPCALARVGNVVAKEVIKKVVEHSFKKYPGKGRRLGGSRRGAKNIEEGIKRVFELGLDKAKRSGGVGNLFKQGVAKAKKDGFLKVAGEVMSFASAGIVKLVNPQGFAAVFKPNGAFELVFRQDPLKGLQEPILNMEDLPPITVMKEEQGDTGPWQVCDIMKRERGAKTNVREEGAENEIFCEDTPYGFHDTRVVLM